MVPTITENHLSLEYGSSIERLKLSAETTTVEKYASLAECLVNDFLKIQQNNVVSIAAAIHNTTDAKNPLQEIPFFEELSLAIRKKRAFPVLELTTINLNRRFFNEMSDEVLSLNPTYYSKWINSIDFFVELSCEGLRNGGDDKGGRQEKVKVSTQNLIEQIFQENKKLIFLNYPTSSLEKQTGIDYSVLDSTYCSAVNTDYQFLEKQGIELKDHFFSSAHYIISYNGDKLQLRIRKDQIKIFSQNIHEHNIFILPSGFMEIPLIREEINGVFVAEKIYFKDQVIDDVKIHFENGNIRCMTFKDDVKENYELKNALSFSMPECYLVVGFNTDIVNSCNYSYYDRCRDGNLSLRFIDQKQNRILLSSLNSVIRKLI